MIEKTHWGIYASITYTPLCLVFIRREQSVVIYYYPQHSVPVPRVKVIFIITLHPVTLWSRVDRYYYQRPSDHRSCMYSLIVNEGNFSQRTWPPAMARVTVKLTSSTLPKNSIDSMSWQPIKISAMCSNMVRCLHRRLIYQICLKQIE